MSLFDQSPQSSSTAASCSEHQTSTRAEPVIHTLYGQTMGTTWRVCLVAAADRDLNVLHGGIQMQLDRIVAQMSNWERESTISRYNRADAGSWSVLPQPFASVLRAALDIAAASNGAYDPSVGPLVDLWGFGTTNAPALPPVAAIDAVRARVGWQKLRFDERSDALFQPGDLALDLSAIAKGHGVDAVCDFLRSQGVASTLVDIGGELHGVGRKPDGSPWSVAVEHGDGIDLPPCVILLDGLAAATSGDRWHAFMHGGRRYAHSIDPRSGWPVVDAPLAVTVLADSAMRADAWATALTVMGTQAGFAFAQQRGMAARFVERTAGGHRARCTAAFSERLHG